MSETQDENQHAGRGLMLIGLTADVAAVFALFKDSWSVVVLVLGVVAALLSGWQLLARRGKPVDRWVLVAVVGLLAGTVAITVVATRSFTGAPGQAAGSTTPSQTSSSIPSGATAGSPTGATTPTTSTTPSSSLPPSPAGVKRETAVDKPILLTERYSLDLDSTAPDWISVPTTAQTTETEDIYYLYGSLYAKRHLALVKKPEPTRDDCVRAGYQDEYASNKFDAGSWFCVKTSEGTYGRVKVREKESGRLTLDVLVWEARS